MKAPVTLRVIKPQQCVFAFGIPSSPEAFAESKAAVGDYYAQGYDDWDHYNFAFGRNARKAQRNAVKLGVNVRSYVSCQEFAELLSGAFDVIILFSHWSGTAIEFKGGFGTATQVVNSVANPELDDFVDLAVCQSRDFGQQLKRRFPRCVVSLGDRNLSPNLWLDYYLTLFEWLKNNDSCYLDAVRENLKRFTRTSWMSRVRSGVAKNLKSSRELGLKPLGPTGGGHDDTNPGPEPTRTPE